MNAPTFQAGPLLAALLAACATPPAGPADALRPAPDEAHALTLSAAGVQIYECRAGQAGSAPQWAFVAPEARLFDAQGRPAGEHGAGPHWTAPDGSRLQGRVKGRADAPRPDAIAWLLLDTTASGPAGRFSGVTSIQRVDTTGGQPPTSGCDAAALGRQARVPYTADYRLYRRG